MMLIQGQYKPSVDDIKTENNAFKLITGHRACEARDSLRSVTYERIHVDATLPNFSDSYRTVRSRSDPNAQIRLMMTETDKAQVRPCQ